MKPTRRLAPRLRARRAPLRRHNRRLAPRLRARRAPLRGPKRPKPAGRNKKRKLKVPKIPPTPKGPPPSYFELLQEAITTLREAGKGASLAQIRRQLQRKYRGRFDKASNDLLTTALQRLAERGKVISKEGHKYRFKVSKSAYPSTSPSISGTSRSEASQSGATSGSIPSDFGATTAKNVDSHTSASSSFTDTNRSNESPKDEASEDKSPENFDNEGKSSTGDSSSSAPSASSTVSRASSKRH